MYPQLFKGNESLSRNLEEAVQAMDKNMIDALAAKHEEDMKAGRANADEVAIGNPGKLFLNTYTRVVAKEVGSRREEHAVRVNAMCPGLVKTRLGGEFVASLPPELQRRIIDVTIYKGQSIDQIYQTPTEAAQGPVWLSLLPPAQAPHGRFFCQKHESTF